MATQVIRDTYGVITTGKFCLFGVGKKTNTGGGDKIPSNEMHFTTTTGNLSYVGNVGDIISFSDGTTYTVLGEGSYMTDNVPSGKHKVKLVSERIDGYVGIDGEALIELHNFPTLSTIIAFDFYPNNSSPNLVKVPTTLPPNITHTQNMFFGATSFNQDISMWDISNVIVITNMFQNATSFNQDISSWNVSNVTEMYGVFQNSTSFNQDISGWNVSNVTDMGRMFSGATSFDQDISGWNVSNVTDMYEMFYDASSFNQDLSSWCVPNITQEPDGFTHGSPLTSKHKPVWGTCPA